MRILALALGLIFHPLFIGFASAQLTVELRDYVTLPMTGSPAATGQVDAMLARVNGVVEEPGGGNRLFINDLNGPLYILDKNTKQLSVYLDFNGRGWRPGLFDKFAFDSGFGMGLAFVVFDPDYRRNGKFYTAHMEEPTVWGLDTPDNAAFPGLKLLGYAPTPAVVTPGPIQREAIVIEWTDTNISNSTFEGTSRELLRVQLNTRIHPLGEMTFNPAARRGDPEWRVMYIGSGDGGAGELKGSDRMNPQRLDTLVGKILRIIPDLNEHTKTSTISDNGRYRIPNDNPFVGLRLARKEIWAVGLRNPHRLSWAVDPANPRSSRLIATSIGLHTWETVYIIKRGANYGYSLREGNQLLREDNTTADLPAIDEIPLQITETLTEGTVTPTYPVVQYTRGDGGGDAVGSGFVYNGKAVPALRGKFIFTDLSTGRMWAVDYKEMLAADDGNPKTMARRQEVKILWDDPSDAPDKGKRLYDSMFPIVELTYHHRGGKDPDLPGRGRSSGPGRADARFAIDAAGELYLMSKMDGVIRAVVAATANSN
jgi:glucose/sorbosone dehydrogenase